jgi:hypothetical protein
MADGDLQGGLRNLYDFHGLLTDWHASGGDDSTLIGAAHKQGLGREVARAMRLATALYGEQDAKMVRGIVDRLFLRRLKARDAMGRETRKGLRLAFYVRSHLLRMPLTMLLRHLWVKWRR